MSETIDLKWIGELPDPTRPSVLLVAILALSNEAEAASDPFERRLRLNELHEGIQSKKAEIEALAEGLLFQSDDGEEDGTAA